LIKALGTEHLVERRLVGTPTLLARVVKCLELHKNSVTFYKTLLMFDAVAYSGIPLSLGTVGCLALISSSLWIHSMKYKVGALTRSQLTADRATMSLLKWPEVSLIKSFSSSFLNTAETI
jgi:hypothetical protein